VLPPSIWRNAQTITPIVRPMVAAYRKNSPSAAVALSLLIPAEMIITRTNWPISSGSHHWVTVVSRVSLVPTRYATPADRSRPANIQPNAPISSCWTSAGEGRTPSWDGVYGLTDI
jgi:hypothetical protein